MCFSEWVKILSFILNTCLSLEAYRNIERQKIFTWNSFFFCVSFRRKYKNYNPVLVTVTCKGFCTKLCKSASLEHYPESKMSWLAVWVSLHLYTVNGTFYTNCPVLRGQMNVSFRKADSLLYSSWCVGLAPTVLELEQTGHSRWAVKDCVLVRLLHL